MTRCFGLGPNEESLVQQENDEAPDSDGRSQAARSVGEGTTTDEEMESQSRMSRRSSVLVDLLSLFRRSSSALRPHHYTNKLTATDGEDDDDEEDTRNMSKDRILEAIRHKKEIIGKLRSQAWNMKRKRRTLKVAQRHLQRQEAKVSKVRLYKAEAGRRLTMLSRWFDNFKIYLIPWEAKIKRIESHFGSVVSSYFTFLRWTLGINVTMTCIMLLFVSIPEWLADSRMEVGSLRYNRTKLMKVMPDDIRKRADELSTVWDFGGHMQYSLLFYGYYSRETFFGETIKYKVPVAYFLVNLFVLGYSFFTILRKMASNARNSKLSSGKTEQYVFNWKSFTGWDYTIGNSETAGNVHMANVIKFRETIAEYAVNVKKKFAWLQIFARMFANLLVFLMLGFSVWAIWAVSQIKETDTFIKQNAVSITVSFITLIFPNIFELIGKLEQYHPRTALRIQLARVLCLYIVNYYTLIVSLMFKLKDLEAERQELEESHRAAMDNRNLHGIVNHTLNRSLRQVLQSPSDSRNYYSYQQPSTTIAPPKPWTTVFSDFGPIGVSNPKVIFTNTAPNIHNSTLVVTHAIGPNVNWNHTDVVSVEGPSVTYTQPYRQPNYQDMCWETIIGQEITKLVTMDLLMTVAAVLVIDFLRGLMCRYCNTWWFWNLEKTFPEYGEFKVAENVLHLVNNQGMIWLGLFFVPMLPMINNIKLIILMYVRGWAVMTCNVPARQIFRASRSSNFYLMLLLLMLFLCTLPVGYVIASRSPSKSCGPFGDQPHFFSVITDVMTENLNASLVDAIKYMTSPGIVIPVLLLLLLVIYFLFALVRGLREANSDLSTQLMHERTEEKKKIFELAGGAKKKNNGKTSFAGSKSTSKAPAPPAVYSSDDDSHGQLKSIGSVGRGSTRGGFVPSLGSVSEVDHSDNEEEEEEKPPTPPKLSLKQKFLVCIGWSDPKQYTRIPDAEEGTLEKKKKKTERIDEESEEDEEDKEDGENRYLLASEQRTRSSRETSKRSDVDGTRDTSYRTTSQSSHRKGDDRSPKRTSPYGSYPLEKEYVVPQPRIIENPLLNTRRTHSASPADKDRSSTSSSYSDETVSMPPTGIHRKDEKDDKIARRLFQPVSSTHNTRYGAPPPPRTTEPDSTRPPSLDGSLSDPAPNDNSFLLNPHSSYTSAMMSPIMADILSTDEGTDDEKIKLKPPRPPQTQNPIERIPSAHSTSTATNSPIIPRPPRFRISMSPPRKKQDGDDSSGSRRFEMRVASPKERGTGGSSSPQQERRGMIRVTGSLDESIKQHPSSPHPTTKETHIV